MLSLATLTDGFGDGSLQVTVDAYGGFGRTSEAGDALYDPPGVDGPSGTVWQSGVFFSPLNDFLMQGTVLPPAAFDSTSLNTATSTFTTAGFGVHLTQTLGDPTPAGTTLQQQYVFTNNTGSAQTFHLVRYADGEMSFLGGDPFYDYGTVSANGRWLFEFDNGVDPNTPEVYFGVTASGDLTPQAYTIQQWIDPVKGFYMDVIRANNGIPAADQGRIYLDNNGDRITDSAYIVTLSLQDQLTVAAGASVVYTTQTVFGRAPINQVINPGQFAFSQPVYTVDEQGATATITVDRVGGSNGTVSVGYSTSSGSATDGADYSGVSGTLVFDTGVDSQTFTIPILDDRLVEGNESIMLHLSNPTGGASIGPQGVAALTIVDNEQPGEFRFSQPAYNVSENGGSATITVERANGNFGPVSIGYFTTDNTAQSGTDYVPVANTLFFADGVSSRTITIPIVDDTAVQGDASFTLTLINPAGGAVIGSPNAAVVNIVENDSAFIFDSPFSAAENSGSATITVRRVGNQDVAASVDYATSDGTAIAGADYTAVSGTLSFNPGQQTATFQVPLTDDRVEEPTETVSLLLSNPSGLAQLGAAGTLNILNTDYRPPQVQSVRLLSDPRGLRGVVITYDEAMAPVNATLYPMHYSLFTIGRRGALTNVAVQSESYDASTHSATVLTRGPMRLNQMYQVNITANGLSDMVGNTLDGNADGIGGDNYRANFIRSANIAYTDRNGDLVRLNLRRGGTMDLIQGADGEARELRIQGVFGRTRITGSVARSRSAGDGVTSIDDLLGDDGITMALPGAFVINHHG